LDYPVVTEKYLREVAKGKELILWLIIPDITFKRMNQD
jgi:hypothetical protein